ncbi:hypothetical protein SEA_BABYDOTZ_73 [Microbacterium phage BabyDotz]|nr:hypothetical protein SEA_BABYDOTZ_73 [Microbacterium phage BabyDotz]
MADFDRDAPAATTIHLSQKDGYQPPPIHLDAERRVLGGLGPDNGGAALIGFAPPNDEEMSVLADDAFADPTLAVGLWPMFGKAGIIRWAAKTKRLEFVEVSDG